MQKINEEYCLINKALKEFPKFLKDLKVGHTIFVNGSECIVTSVSEKTFTAVAKISKRKAMFDKETGYGIFNFKIRAILFN